MGLFTDLFSDKPAKEAADALKSGYSQGLSNAGAQLTYGQQNADALYGQASAPYQDLMTSTGRGSAAYGDATGANGAEGLARAKALYQADPGYSGGLTTGIDQVARTAAMRGDLGGGNTSADIIKFASDYDANKYGNYVQSLAPYLGANASAVGGYAGTKTGQAGLDTGIYGQRATNEWNAATGSGKADADADLAKYSASGNFWNAR
jgi:hypothetical protein